MTGIPLSALCRAYPNAVIHPTQAGENDPLITSIVYDSRRVEPGALFFAVPGMHTDGHRFIGQAIEAGAAAVLYQNDTPVIKELRSGRTTAGDNPAGDNPTGDNPTGDNPTGDNPNGDNPNGDEPAGQQDRAKRALPPLIRCDDSKAALSAMSAAFYGYPAREMLIIGVTGTDGKSSTVSYLHQMVQSLGIPAGFISTVAMQSGESVEDNTLRQSTPEAPEIHGLLRSMADSGKLVAVVESTSHGLSHKTSRLRDVQYHAALFTNLTHEHLEFHGSFEQYRSDKGNLFRQLAAPPQDVREKITAAMKNAGPEAQGQPVAVINALDPSGDYMAELAEAVGARVLRYSACQDAGAAEGGSGGAIAAIRASDCESRADSNSFTLSIQNQSSAVELPVPGAFNIDNILACAGVLYALLGASPDAIGKAAASVKGVKGRMLPLFHGQPFSAIVDYAHTPGSFRKVFPLFRESCGGRLIAVFGSAGERDVEKRPVQGQIAAEYADILVITNEDPRLEDEQTIISHISAGARKSDRFCEILEIPNRRNAIKKAFEIALPGDLVVMLGKGHEGSIIMAEGKIPWDEESVARQILEDMGYRRVR